MANDLETRLRNYGVVLDRAAPPPVAGSYLPPFARRRRPRWPYLALAAAGLLLLAGLTVATLGDDSSRVETGRFADQPLETPGPGVFPYLVIEGWEMQRFDESSGPVGTEGVDGGDEGGFYRQAFRDPERGFDGPVASVLTVGNPASYGVGDGRPVEVDGRTVTSSTLGLYSSLSWTTEGGELVVVRSVGLSDDELLAFAGGLDDRGEEPGWDATVLPDGLAAVVEEPVVRRDRYHSAEARFTQGDAEIELSMDEGAAAGLEDLVEDRVTSADDLRGVNVLGRPAALSRYEDSERYSAMWFADGVVYELDGAAGDREGFLAALSALRPVDRGTWEEALPADAVRPSDRATVVEELLRGVELPPGFDVEPLLANAETKDRYQLGAQVAGGVACAWIDRWATARDAGDTATADQAVAVLQGSRSWPVLVEMAAQGDYPEVLWHLVDEMAAGQPVEEDAPNSLGCNSR